jgi:hypothetical protein
MKLELKHLAPYLPSGVFVIESEVKEVMVLHGVGVDRITLSDGDYDGLDRFRLILRPLGEFISEEDIVDEMTHNELLMMGNNIDLVERLSYDVIKLMFKNHFDVFGLIEKGLAIDINTLEK